MPADPVSPADLRADGRRDPIGLGPRPPLLSWKLTGGGRGRAQRAYQVRVAAEADPAADGTPSVWDSGWVESAETVGVECAAAVAERTRYQWRVRVRDESGAESDWSGPASFETGIFGEWAAGWITADAPDGPAGVSLESVQQGQLLRRIWPLGASGDDAFLRRRFTLPPGARPVSAQVVVGGAGQISVRLNGQPVPAVGDVSAALRGGDNVLAVEVRDADPVGVVVRMQVSVEAYRPVLVDSNDGWVGSAAADDGWTEPDFDDSSWPLAEPVGQHGEPPRGREPASYRPASYLRREFSVAAPVRRARLYCTALGVYEMRLNGQRVGEDYLAPGWTDYRVRVPYQVYDVTDAVRAGDNALAAIVADGWYAGNVGWFGQFQYGLTPCLRAQLEVTHDDGSVTQIATDGSWSGGHGGLRYADLQNGTVDDGRLEPAGWDQPGFTGDFGPAAAVRPEHGAMVAADAEPIRVGAEVPAAAVSRRDDGRIFVDFGQNLVGWVRLRLRGPAGERVFVRHAEALEADGELYTLALRSASATDEYVLRGDPDGEVFEPRFTAHGFRHAEISGYSGELAVDDATARVVFSAMEQTGEFACSNPALTKLQDNIVWGQRGNFLSVPTDCPQRDERLGWTGDAQVFASTAAFNYDVRGFFRKWLTDLTDAQHPNGAVSHVAPDAITTGAALRGQDRETGGAPGWGDAIEIIPVALHQAFADRAAVERCYPAARRWVGYLRAESKDLIRPGGPYGDWLAITPTPKELVATAFFAQAARVTGDMAEILGEDRAEFDELHAAVRRAFRAAFVHGGGRVASGTQTAYVLALHFGLLDEAEAPLAAQHLADDIRNRNWHLTTGFLGTPYLLSALTGHGHLDVAYRLLMQDTFPSWLYPVVHGDATTIWERWDSWSDSRGFQDPGMTSFNHYAYGAVGEWIYRCVGGIAPAGPGYREIEVRPRIGGGLTWARCGYESVRGRIAVEWSLDGDRLSLRVQTPPNTSATVWVPCSDEGSVAETGGFAGVERLRAEPGAVVYRVGSGVYEFTSAR